MITYSFGEVVLVPFPFSDLSTIKKRPAVIINTRIYSNSTKDVIIIAVTSNTENNTMNLDMTITNIERAGLYKESLIKPAIATIEKKIISKKIGELSDNDKNNLMLMLKNIIEFN
jgi:mRNA interferase MazF